MILRDDSEAPRIQMNGRQKLFILAIDLAIISELCIAMSVATANPDNFTPAFMKIFFAMFLPTLVAGFLGHRKLRDRTESARS
ncbi:MAG: hypothetical protein AB9900_13685 [Humidesulfovibrio sp.]